MEKIPVKLTITREGKKDLVFEITFKLDEDDQLKAVFVKQFRTQLETSVTEWLIIAPVNTAEQ